MHFYSPAQLFLLFPFLYWVGVALSDSVTTSHLNVSCQALFADTTVTGKWVSVWWWEEADEERRSDPPSIFLLPTPLPYLALVWSTLQVTFELLMQSLQVWMQETPFPFLQLLLTDDLLSPALLVDASSSSSSSSYRYYAVYFYKSRWISCRQHYR